jgi:polar amino acid transport system substrate-binding protein
MQLARHPSPQPRSSNLPRRAAGLATLLVTVVLNMTFASLASAQTLERIRETGHIKLGYFADARPFSYETEGTAPQGYTITLCEHIAAQVKSELSMPGLTVDWKEVQPDRALEQVSQGNIDLLCAPVSVTIDKRRNVSFSLPIFAAGNRAVIRTNASSQLRNVLTQQSGNRPVWRGSPAATVLTGTKVGVAEGTTSEQWLKERIGTLQIDAKLVPVEDYRMGIQRLAAGELDMFFGERTVVLGVLSTMDRSVRESVEILDRLFTHEPIALALARNNDDFRAVVDSALSRLYASEQFPALYTKCCGELNEEMRSFFSWNALREGAQ